MRAFWIFLFGLIITLPVQAQKPPINGVAGPTTSDQLRGIMTDSAGTGALLFGGADINKLTQGSVPVSITSNILSVDLSLGLVFHATNDANINSFSITVPPEMAGQAIYFSLFLIANGSTFTQSWGSIRWNSGFTPVVTTTNGKADLFTFVSYDGGTTWFGLISGQNM